MVLFPISYLPHVWREISFTPLDNDIFDPKMCRHAYLTYSSFLAVFFSRCEKRNKGIVGTKVGTIQRTLGLLFFLLFWRERCASFWTGVIFIPASRFFPFPKARRRYTPLRCMSGWLGWSWGREVVGGVVGLIQSDVLNFSYNCKKHNCNVPIIGSYTPVPSSRLLEPYGLSDKMGAVWSARSYWLR